MRPATPANRPDDRARPRLLHALGGTTGRLLTALVLSALIVAGFSAPSLADDKRDLRQQRSGVEGRIGSAQGNVAESTKQLKAAQAKLDDAKAKLSAAEATLGETRGQLAVAKAEDERLQARLEQTQAELDLAVAKLKQGEKDLATAEAEVERFTVESVQQGDSGMRAFGGLLTGEEPSDFTEQMSINDSVGDAQLAKMQELDATRVVLKLKRDDVEKLRNEVKKQREEAAANLKVQEELEAAAAEQAAAVATLVQKQAGAAREADAALAKDLSVLRELEAERTRLNNRLAAIAARELAEARARERANANSGGGGGSSSGGSSGGDGGGTLSRPVNGPTTSQYGMRVHPITGVYKLHDGLDFGVACGTPIRAAASGTVIEQYFNAGYGNRVILNNGVKRGQSVITTYNHLSRYAVGVGSRVSRGQVIGYVGSTGYSTGCHLHFMVIANGATTNPAGWL